MRVTAVNPAGRGVPSAVSESVQLRPVYDPQTDFGRNYKFIS